MTNVDTKPLSILHLTTDSKLGGAEQLLIWIAKHVDRSRYHLKFCTISKWGPLNDMLKQMGHSVFSLEMENVFGFLKARRKFQKILASEKPHLVHSHLLLGGLLAACSTLKDKHIHHRHYADFFRGVRGGPKNAIDSFLMQQVPKILAVSKAVESDLIHRLKISPKKISVLNNAIDLDEFNIARVGPLKNSTVMEVLANKQKPVIGLVGNFHPGKGHKVLLNALPALLKKWPHLVVLFLGEGRGQDAVRDHTKRMGVEKQVRFCGFEKNIASVIVKMDMLVVPSLSEGFGLVACEAMALNIPVIASRIEGLKDIIEHNHSGILFEKGNSNDLAASIQRLIEDANLRAKIVSQASRDVVARFSMADYAVRLQEYYDETMRGAL